MSHKRNRRKHSSGARVETLDPANPPAGAQGGGNNLPPAGGSIPQADVAQIGRYLAENNTKSAVKRAKAVHTHFGTAVSEALLVDAYIARIRAMESAGMSAEARALADLVEHRYPSGPQKLREMRTAPGVAAKDAVAMAAELAGPDLPVERRRQIEEAVRRHVTDLPRLAKCGALPADHPLRQAAGAVWRAFQAVTAGPTDADQTRLPEVSHRSPLADWKLLIRAIDCFYRRQDDACRRLVDAMKADSAAAKLAAPLRAMLDGRPNPGLSPQAAALVDAVQTGDKELRQALADLEAAFQCEEQRKLKKPVRRAVEQCRKARPELLERLKQLISARGFAMEWPASKALAAMGGPSLHDSRFWSLLARVVDLEGQVVLACAMWEEFRRHAVHEGRFRPDGPEAAALYLHMTDLLRTLPPAELWRQRSTLERRFLGFPDMYKGQPPAVRALAPDPNKKPDLYFVYPERIYERLCQSVADAEAYARWLAYARGDSRARVGPQEVAERWHGAIPSDSRPLLFLAEQAEERKALTKALKYLDQAEALDGLSPAVKRARLRLWVANAIRHLRDGKPHLAQKDFAAMDVLPQSRDGDRPALLAALKWISAKLSGEAAAAADGRAGLAGLFGGEEAADVLLTCVGRVATKGGPLVREGQLGSTGQALVRSVGRTCVVLQDAGIRAELPMAWHGPLVQALTSGGPHDLVHLRALSEAALAEGWPEVAFAATGSALGVPGPHRARFLLLRAWCLGPGTRRRACLEVAAELARRQRDMDLLAAVMDEIGTWLARSRPGDLSVSDEIVDQVLKYEAGSKSPKADRRPGAAGTPAGASDRRRSGGRTRQPSLFDGFLDTDEYEDEDEDDEDSDESDEWYDDDIDESEDGLADEEDDDWDEDLDEGVHLPLPPGPPPEIMALILEIIARSGGRTPTFRELDRILASDPKLRAAVVKTMGKYGPPPGLEDVLNSVFGIVGPHAQESRAERRARRKKDRRNRRP